MQTIWKFETKRFRVSLEIMPEEIAPEDCFEFDGDIKAVRDGEVEWFCASVVVYRKLNGREIEISRDSLGCCAYRTYKEFFTSHRDANPMNRNCSIMRAAKENVTICYYFPSMVRTAIQLARETIGIISYERPLIKVNMSSYNGL